MKRISPRHLWIFILLALMAAVLAGGCGGGETAAPDALTTAAPAGTSTQASTQTVTVPPVPGASYTFAVTGDNRTEGIEKGVLGRITDSAKERGAAFIVNTGDVSYEATPEELTIYQDFTEAAGIPFYTVVGNHDMWMGRPRQDFEDIVGPLYQSFDYGSDHFILLNNADDEAGIDEPQMQWYTADLEASRGKTNTFIFTHIPVGDPDLDSDHVTGEKGSAGRESGIELVEKATAQPSVRAFFFGHIHAYLAYELNGVDAYVTGGAGAPLSFPEEAGGYYHYLLVKVNGTQVDVEVVKV